eukprot:2564484-Rhodomonas_salina.1
MVGSLAGHEHYVSSLTIDDEMSNIFPKSPAPPMKSRGESPKLGFSYQGAHGTGLVTGSWDRTLRIWRLPEDGRVSEVGVR